MGAEAIKKMLRRLELQKLSDEQLEAGGVGPDMVRLSVGLEDLEDIIWDLDQALHAAGAVAGG